MSNRSDAFIPKAYEDQLFRSGGRGVLWGAVPNALVLAGIALVLLAFLASYVGPIVTGGDNPGDHPAIFLGKKSKDKDDDDDDDGHGKKDKTKDKTKDTKDKTKDTDTTTDRPPPPYADTVTTDDEDSGTNTTFGQQR